MATTIQQLPIPDIPQRAESFFQLWPSRFDWLYAEHPDPGTSPNWYTERRFPLTDRAIDQGKKLYGVRFGKTTAYVMIDVDRRSVYHPDQDEFGIVRIRQAMETIGLTDCLVCTSSYSGGLHLYFPFPEERKSWAMGIAVTMLMERQGFKVKPGQLEVFPNARGYSAGLPLFNGHRLPMQAGSYVLNADLAETRSNRDSFAVQWGKVQQRNQIDAEAIERLLKTRSRKFAVTTGAEKFLNDLNATIQEGWTDRGQTNYLLGRIAMRSYIFGHVLYASEPLVGEALVEDIVKVAKGLPGYREWCGHQSDIETRAGEWASCIEKSEYFHYGKREIKLTEIAQKPDGRKQWNESQQQAARERIRSAIADLLEQGKLAIEKTDRFNQLIQYRISGSTLYKHRDLWEPSVKPERSTANPPNLLECNGCNNPAELASSDPEIAPQPIEGCNQASRLDDWVAPPVMRENPGRTIGKDNLDLSELLAEIQIMQIRLDWSREDLAIYVAENFAGRTRRQLRADELVELADRLERLVVNFDGIP